MLKATCPNPLELLFPERRDTESISRTRPQTVPNKTLPKLVILAHYPLTTGLEVPLNDSTRHRPVQDRLAGSLQYWTMRRIFHRRLMTMTRTDHPHVSHSLPRERSGRHEDRETTRDRLRRIYHTSRRISMELHDQAPHLRSMAHRSDRYLQLHFSLPDDHHQCVLKRRIRKPT